MTTVALVYIAVWLVLAVLFGPSAGVLVLALVVCGLLYRP